MERDIRMSKDEDTKFVLTYLQSVIEDRLKKHMPGLLLSLNMHAFSRYGKYAPQLFASNPLAFVNILKIYFRGNDELVIRLLRYLLKPLNDAGSAGQEAIESLVKGDEKKFIEIATRLLKKEAKKWFK